MREIKFRVWSVSDKFFIKNFQYFISQDGRIGYIDGTNYLYPTDGFIASQIILEQYTGLKDLNGKEIYEGDILEGFDEVKFKDGRYYCNKKGARIFTLEELCCDTEYPAPKIIGNIHENPELLK